MKRKYTRNIQKLRSTQGCLTECVAFFFNVHPQNVPYFVYPRKNWNKRLKDYFDRRGYIAYWTVCDKPPARGTHIVCGLSLKWRTAGHAVVYRNGKLKFDPQFPSLWKDSRITHRLIVAKFK